MDESMAMMGDYQRSLYEKMRREIERQQYQGLSGNGKSLCWSVGGSGLAAAKDTETKPEPNKLLLLLEE